MTYYDHIAKKWHSFSGAHGGAFKKYALYGVRQVLNAKPGLRQAGKGPIAMLLECQKLA